MFPFNVIAEVLTIQTQSRLQNSIHRVNVLAYFEHGLHEITEYQAIHQDKDAALRVILDIL